MNDSRRTFLQAVVILGGAGVAAQLVGCGDPEPATDAGTDSGGTDSGTEETDAGGGGCTPDASIAANHGHALTVSSADVTAAADKTYSIQAAAGHDHMVTITAAQFGTLAGGGTLSLTSTSSGHTHSITVTCG